MQPLTSPSRPVRPASRAGGRTVSILTREPLLLLALLLVAFYFGRPILIPIALALTFAFLLTPLVTRLERLRFRRAAAALTVLLATAAVLGLVLWLVAGQLLTVVNDLPDHAENLRTKLAATHVPQNSSVGRAVASLEGLSREIATSQNDKSSAQHQPGESARTRRMRRRARSAQPTDTPPQPVFLVPAPTSELVYLRDVARPLLAPLGTALMVVVFTVYMLLKREDLRNRILLLAGMGRLNLVSQALDDAGERISRYLIANGSVNAGIGIVFAAGLYAIGIPYATLWGALLALLRTVPYVGVLVGGSLPTLFALIYFPGWWESGCAFALIALLEILVSNFLEPWLYGAHTGISELALLVMAIVWTLLWGWPGLLLSTPLTVCLIVIGRTMPQMSFLHVLLGDDAELAPEARFYERMLAMDQREAQKVVDRFLAQPAEPSGAVPGGSPLQLYEAVLLPALILAESDRHKGALEDSRAAVFMQSAAELIAELAERAHASTPAPLPLFDEAERPGEHTSGPGTCCPVVCVPAGDQADEIAATMLAQLLDGMGHKTLLLPGPALTPDLLARYQGEPQTTLCISAVPPFEFGPAQELYQRIRPALPHNRILVCLWHSPVQPDLLRRRLAMESNEDLVVTTLARAVEAIRGLEPQEPETDIYARAEQQPAAAAAP